MTAAAPDAPPGTLTFEEGVFRAIATHVLDEIDGVRLGTGHGGIIQRIRNRINTGVQVRMTPGSVAYDISVVVRAAGDLRAACRTVQIKVAQDTRHMTGLERIDVHVSVRGIE